METPDGINIENDIIAKLLQELIENMKLLAFQQSKMYKDFSGILKGDAAKNARHTYEFEDKISFLSAKQVEKLSEFSVMFDKMYKQNKSRDENMVNLLKRFYDFTQSSAERQKAYQERSGTNKEYLSELRKFQDRNVGGALLDHYLSKSPFLKLLMKRDPDTPGSEMEERDRSRDMLKYIYTKKQVFNRDRQVMRFIGDTFKNQYMNGGVPVYPMDQPQIGQDERKFITDGKNHSKAGPSEGDIQNLPAVYGEPTLYIGGLLEQLIDKDSKDRDVKMGQGFLDNFFKGGSLAGLLGKMLPSILSIALPMLGIGTGLAGLVLAINAAIADTKKRQEEAKDLNAEVGGEAAVGSITGGIVKNKEVSVMANAALGGSMKNKPEEVKEAAEKFFSGGNEMYMTPEMSKAYQEAAARAKPSPGSRSLLLQKNNDGTYSIGNTKYAFTNDEKMKWVLSIDPDVAIEKPPKELRGELGLFDWWVDHKYKFHTGGVVPGNIGEEKAIVALAGERVLSPEQSKQYEVSSNESSNMDEHIIQLVELNKQLLDEMRNNTKVTQDGAKKESSSPIAPASRRFEKVPI